MTTTTKQYNFCLDFIKGIACICVVLMHCEFPGKLGIMVQAMSRFCVPFFFMVSGYFAINLAPETNGLRGLIFNKKVLHIAKITLYSAVFYLAFAIVQNWIWDDVSIKANKTEILIFLFFNSPFIIAGQLWFLFALLYDYILITILDRFKLQKLEYVLGIVMLVLFFFMGQGVHLIGGGIPVPDFVVNDFAGNIPHMEGNRVPVPNFLYRNFLFEGFAFFMLGRLVYKNKDKLKFSNTTLLIVVAISTILCLVERQFMGRDFGVNLCTLPQVVALFIYGINNPKLHKGTIQQLGKNCSMLVYILHPFVWHSMERVYNGLDIANNITALYLLPIIVVLLSISLAMLCNWFADNVQLKKQIVK
jgi:surface polysaccharide O-acyltransferase-like enzyme